MYSTVVPVTDNLARGISRDATRIHRFYRPELDLLRFFAFLSVFMVHSPRFHGASWFKRAYNHSLGAGAFGLCLFFFLSSYLITELLLQERESTGTIHLKQFYQRRILRIWPLYYLGVVSGILYGLVVPTYHLSGIEITKLLLLVGWLGSALLYNPFGILWSISVEELFYAIWPGVAKKGIVRSASLVLIPLAIAASFYKGFNSWFNPLVHFLYFASGALLALALHGRPVNIPVSLRCFLALSGVALWLLPVSPLVRIWPLAYPLVDLGCVALFLSVFGIPKEFLPEWPIYLGKISYGLYVFHGMWLYLIGSKVAGWLPGNQHEFIRLAEINSLALGATIGLASLSYRYFETPFLRWKKRLEYVKSREA